MKCPYCRKKDYWKWNPPRWVWLTPGAMRNCRCNVCGHEFIRYLYIFSMSHGMAHFFCIVWHFFLLTLVITAASVVLPTLLK